MAGRGRATSSFTQEQLQTLGCVGKDMPNVALAPPPLFPTLLSKPVTLETNNIRDYRILWKEDFISYLKESPYYSESKTENKYEAEDIVVALEKEKKARQQGEFLWKTMPAELRPNFKRTKKHTEEQKKKRMVDIVEKLKILEQEEDKNPGGKKTTGKLDSDGENEENELEDEVQDEEMDEDIDYGNNYFDNGEAFNEEDDNMDDGPVY